MFVKLDSFTPHGAMARCEERQRLAHKQGRWIWMILRSAAVLKLFSECCKFGQGQASCKPT